MSDTREVDHLAKGWPGYCQNCKNPLTPIDRTDCPNCGADDLDD